MQDHRLAGREVGEQVFRPPPEAQHAGAGQPFGQTRRKGAAQVGAAHLGAGDHMTLHHRLKAAADGLDFGQFGHGAPPLAAGFVSERATG